ncbi:hypothetical protein PpBr36_08678 [Pyricularia pennisetigena]|uniref:hypothetical protein n=1 Tax=Pyricularia pennisetigena TaxID=1578925 RepID=UPI0011549A78|nr:hypothetical protein PpBr36_08678 [Pyricularia pennisetigena]TLS24255.1 hypothetical protein PpBr36_08678 [Pyricularia pennisetigena]
MLRPTLRIPLRRQIQPLRPLVQRRFEHLMPVLQKDKQQFLQHGIGPQDNQFLSARAVDLAWTQYMTLALKKLNRLTNGKANDISTGRNSLRDLAIRTARDPLNAPTFNYASMAHNNHFFFDGLSSEPVEIPNLLREQLEQDFGSIETLQREFLVTALAMFGPGFVWLVKTKTTSGKEIFRLLPTYLAGTPYPKAHYRRQTVDMNTVDSQGPEVNGVDGWMSKQQAAVSDPSLQKTEKAHGGISDSSLTPVLCLNTWEHVWTTDYGIIYGEKERESKRLYITRWWRHIDWDVVSSLANIRARPDPKF